jgi:hypothetical protein
MLDWPLYTQTSPTWTLVKLTLALPEVTVIVLGNALADMLARLTCHLPSLSATADPFWFRNCTVTVTPGSAAPNTGTAIPCCNTMSDLKIGDTVKAANAEVELNALKNSPHRTATFLTQFDVYL